MRHSRVLLLVAGAALLAACGDDTGPSNAVPTAAFAVQCEPLECRFTNSSTDADGTIDAYDWDFGDNSAKVTTRDAVHTYAASGRFTVTLAVTDDDGETATATALVGVGEPNNVPTARFTFSCDYLTCDFTDQSFAGTPGVWVTLHNWDFGDDSDRAATPNAAHTYAAPGQFTVRLTVQDAYGASASVTALVDLSDPNFTPTASFTYSCSDLACTFTDQSFDDDGSLASYAWDFGDGQTSTEKNPEHIFAFPATYPVGLTVTDDRGVRGHMSITVTVPPPVAPTIDFSVTCSGLECTFTDESTDGAFWAWYWDFGDGETSTERNPTHVYDATEVTTFTVTLSVWDLDLGGGSVSHEVTVAPNVTSPTGEIRGPIQ